MKPNPPETAPKDGTEILVTVLSPRLHAAVWDDMRDKWLVAFGQCGDLVLSYQESITGWLPMPEIDEA